MRLRRADSSRLPRHTHARATRRSGCSRSSIRSITREPGQMCTVTKLSIMLFQRISMLSRLTSGVAAGPGIRVLPGGCSEPASKVFRDCEFGARHCILIRAFRRRGQDSASCFDTAPLATKYRSKTHRALVAVSSLPPWTARRYREIKRVFL